MKAMKVQAGDRLLVRTAFGEWLPRTAASSTEPGATFEVVWVCRDEEWARAAAGSGEPDAVPWPADAVRPRAQPL